MAHGQRAALHSNSSRAYSGRRPGNVHWIQERSRRAGAQGLSAKQLTHRMERRAAVRTLKAELRDAG